MTKQFQKPFIMTVIKLSVKVKAEIYFSLNCQIASKLITKSAIYFQ